MVLQEGDERRRGQFGRRLATPPSAPKRRRGPLIGKTFGERTTEMLCRPIGVIAVVAPALPSDEEMQDVVQIVIPLRRIARRVATAPGQTTRLIAIGFEDEMKFPTGNM